jgi:gluconokinase
VARAEVVLGADIGTSSAKVVAFDTAGRAHAHAERAYPLDTDEPGQAVQDPGRVSDAAVAALEEAAGAAREAGCDVAGVAFSSAMHSLVGLDGDGRALTPLLTWADTRAREQAERLRAESPELHARTGTPLHPMSPLAKLVWLREREPETFASVRRWCGIKELVLERLTGTWAMDRSCASGTGLMGMESLDWDPDALEAAGIAAAALPALVDPTERLALSGQGASETGLPEGTTLVAGAGDGPLANLGVGAVHPGAAACSIGTSAALRLMVEQPAIDPAGHLFCYLLTEGRWVTGGAINNGGAVLEWAGQALAPDLGEHAAQELLALAAEVPPGSEGLLMLPYLLSERAPHWSGTPRGAYVGLTREHGRGHLVRAAIEGVCLQLALVLASVREAGEEVRAIRATGGFARSEMWRQMLADALDTRLGFPSSHEGSAFGAALLGMEALGLVESIDVAADLVAIDKEVQPDSGAAGVYAELLPVFDELYEQLEPAFRALTGRP